MIMHYQIDEEKSGVYVRGRDRDGVFRTVGEAMYGLEGKPSDPNGTRERGKAALARHAAGEALTEREWTIVQYARRLPRLRGRGNPGGREDDGKCGLRSLRVRLRKSLWDMAGNAYPEGSVVLVVFALDGVPEVVGACYLPICEPCGRVFDIPEKPPALGAGFAAETDRIEVYGRRRDGCEDCTEIAGK
jgi:hypothetical protein